MIEKTRLTEEASKSRVLLNLFLAMLVAYLFVKGGIATAQMMFPPIFGLVARNPFLLANKEFITQFAQLLGIWIDISISIYLGISYRRKKNINFRIL